MNHLDFTTFYSTSRSDNFPVSLQARFILEKCDGSLVIENKKKKDMIAELQRKGYDSDPVKAWKKLQDMEAALVSAAGCFCSLCIVLGGSGKIVALFSRTL